MADSWFTLSREDQAEALEVAAAQTGRPPHLLKKDIWVVWTLSAIYESALAEKLTFKGGTSLSKVYKVIDRFWEKATAAHVYCRQGRLRGERYSRHWYDLAAMANSGHAQTAIDNHELSHAVAEHKSMFFAEKDVEKNPIDYKKAVST